MKFVVPENQKKVRVDSKGPAGIEKQETACQSALLHHTFPSLSLTRPLRGTLTFRSPCILKVCSHKGNRKHASQGLAKATGPSAVPCASSTGEQYRVLALVSDVNVLLRRDPAWHT